MRIGELADAVEVSVRTVRHYHRVGVLPEPVRRANGYRVYGLRDVLRLARARRLTELGLSLDEVAELLAGDDDRDLGALLDELDADLARQEERLRTRRERLAALRDRARGGRLDADDAVSAGTARLLGRIAGAFPDSDTARRDREYLALLDGTPGADAVRELYDRALDDPAQVARVGELYRRFDELAAAAPDDPRVEALAADLAAALPAEVTGPMAAGMPPDVEADPFGAAFLADLAPAQAEVARLMIRTWSAG